MAGDRSLVKEPRRAVYIEIPGSHARTQKDTGSRANMKYLNHVISLVEGPLHRIYGDETSKKGATMAPHSRQQELYEIKLRALGEEKGLSESAIPPAVMVDRARGRERNHVVLDEVDCMSGEDDMGLRYSGPSSLTFVNCAHKARWTVGGKPSESTQAAVDEVGMSKYIFVFLHGCEARADCLVPTGGQTLTSSSGLPTFGLQSNYRDGVGGGRDLTRVLNSERPRQAASGTVNSFPR